MTGPSTAVMVYRAVIAFTVGVVMTVLSLSLFVVPSSATLSFPDPQTTSEGGQGATNAQVALDSSGRATIVWVRNDGTDYRIQSVRVTANGTLEDVQTLSDSGNDAQSPQVAIDSSDRATITWQQDDGSDQRVQSVRLASDGTPGTIQTLSGAGQNAYEPMIAIDSSDRATITWSRAGLIQSVRLAADGNPGAFNTLSEPGQPADGPDVAIDSSDRATVTWLRYDGTNNRTQSVRIAADGTPGTVKTLSEAGQYTQTPQVAIDSSGRSTVTWTRYDGSNSRVQAVRLAADGTPGAVQTLSASGQTAEKPQVAVDESGRATIAWYRSDGTKIRIQSVRLDANGTPEPVQTLSEAGKDAYDQRLAIDGSGRATIVWIRNDGSNYRVQAVRLGADGTPGTVKTLSDIGHDGNYPQIAMDESDRATITWHRSDGSDFRVQTTRAEIARPETTITSGPEGATDSANPSFGFSSEATGATFQCSLDSEPFTTCVSPNSYSNLGDGPHSFAVMSSDIEGDADLTPATRDFTVDTPFPVADKARIDRVKISGPKKARKGKKVTYKVKITNSGNAEATGVKLKVSGKGVSAKASVGKIKAGKSRVIKVKIKPKRTGRIKAAFKVTSSNAGGKTARKTITVKK